MFIRGIAVAEGAHGLGHPPPFAVLDVGFAKADRAAAADGAPFRHQRPDVAAMKAMCMSTVTTSRA